MGLTYGYEWLALVALRYLEGLPGLPFSFSADISLRHA